LEKISFEIELVTPMFMGGADPQGPLEFRAASLKGLLRFWFRAIYPGQWQEEERLFGSTDYRSPVKITTSVKKLVDGKVKSDKLHDYAYLGYGLLKYDKNKQKNLTERPFFDVGTQLTIHFSFVGSLDQNDREKILRAFWALAMFGGLGARSRRGFGSFKVNSPENSYDLPFSFAERQDYFKNMKAALGEIKKTRKGSLPKHTCFSPYSRVVISPAASSAQKAWQKIGKQFKDYRDYKHNLDAKNDHDLMMDYLWHGTAPKTTPTRAAFGLPHNYFFKKKDIAGQVRPELKGGVDLLQEGKAGRRASPVMMHIQKFADGQASAVVSYLPAQFTPETEKHGEKVMQRLRISGVQQECVKGKKNILFKQKPNFKEPPTFSMVEGFIEELINNSHEAIL